MPKTREAGISETSESVVSYKGMHDDMTCRGFQFEIGKSYEVAGDIEACANGFHACESPLDVFRHYAPAGNRFFKVVQSGKLSRESNKIASAKITIEAELKMPDFIAAAIKYEFDRSTPEGEAATGIRGAASATGYSGAASATGTRGAASAMGIRGAASATGYSGAASATGYSGAASATGECGAASATGIRGAASATGYSGAASATGECGAASATGECGAASATGIRGAASATGECGAASATGYSGAASATGYSGAASATGYSGAASATGTRGAASATGARGRVKGAAGNALFLVYRAGFNGDIKHVWAGIAGQNGILADTWYSLDETGKPVVVSP